MAQSQNLEERLASLEREAAERLASLEQEVKELKQELAKRRTLEGLRTDVQELQLRYQAHEEYVTERLNDVEQHITARMEVLEDNLTGKIDEQGSHIDRLDTRIDGLESIMTTKFQELQQGQQALQAGQEQILAILTGQARTHD